MAEQRGTKTLTLRAFLIGLALALAWLAYDCSVAVYAPLSTIELLALIGFGATFTLFAVTFFNSLFAEERRLTPGELTLIYAMVAVAIPWGILIRGALESPVKMVLLYRTTAGNDCIKWMKPPWCPASLEAIEDFRRGGLAPRQILWREWMSPMVYWGATLLAFQSFAMFLVLLFRRAFIEEERLPFPMAQIGQTLIEYRPSQADEPSRRLERWAGGAFGLGLLVCLPGILSVGPLGARPVPPNVGYYGTDVGIIPRLLVHLTWGPFILCVLMCLSVDILLTVVVCDVGMKIALPMALRWLGVSMERVGDVSSESIVFHVFGVGGLACLAIWTVWFHRAAIAQAVREAFRGKHDASEPVSGGFVLVGLVLSFGAFVGLFLYGVGDLGPYAVRQSISIAIVLAVIVGMLLALMRQNTEEPFHHWSPWSAGKVIAYPHLFYFRHPAPLWQTPASFFQIAHVIHFGALHNVFAPHLHLFDSLRAAHATGADVRGILKAVAVVLVLAVPLVMVGFLVLIHHYGFAHGDTANEYAWQTWSQPVIRMAWEAGPTVFNDMAPWVSVPLGVLLIGLVMYLRREHVGFPFSPVGVVLTAAMSGGGIGTAEIWFAMVLVLAAKATIYRWFGVAFFRRYVMPVTAYAMMGLMTGMLIYKLLFAALGRGFLRAY